MKDPLTGALTHPSNNNRVILDHGVFITWGRNRSTHRQTLKAQVVHRDRTPSDAAEWSWKGVQMPHEIYREFLEVTRAMMDFVIDTEGGVLEDLPD